MDVHRYISCGPGADSVEPARPSIRCLPVGNLGQCSPGHPLVVPVSGGDRDLCGFGTVWAAVKRLTGRDIEILPIDIIDHDIFHLPGNNLSYLGTIDLARFNVIDLDAYGVPYEQLRTIFRRGFVGVVYVMLIQSVVGGLNNALLLDMGFSTAMIEKAPALLCARGWDIFRDWLAQNGITSIWHRSKNRKHHLAFRMISDAVVPVGDCDIQAGGTVAGHV